LACRKWIASTITSAFLDGLAQFERGELNPARLRATLTGWLSEHAASADRQYADCIFQIRQEAGWAR
jgi:hemerythrin